MEWVETYAEHFLRMAGRTPYLDETRVRAFAMPGWRLRNFANTQTPVEWEEDLVYFGGGEDGTKRVARDGEIQGAEQFIAVVQTSAWYTVEADVFMGSIGWNRGVDIRNQAPIDIDELPPLPFRRMLFEVHREGHSRRILSFMDPSSGEIETKGGVDALAVWEVEQGALWDIAGHFRSMDGHSLFPVYRATPHGILDDVLPDWMDELHRETDHAIGLAMRNAAITCAHIVTATNTRTTAGIARKQARAIKRHRFAPSEPKLYRVEVVYDARATGEGAGERKYHCRWMVRGHWRMIDGGRRRVWVRAYVKGPAGAPWKGRPVHVAAGE